MTLFTVLGLAGVAGYLTTYALVQLGMLDGNSLRYSIANVVAASMVMATMLDRFDLTLALVQVAWISLGLVGVIRRVAANADNADNADTAHTTDAAAAPLLELVPALHRPQRVAASRRQVQSLERVNSLTWS